MPHTLIAHSTLDYHRTLVLAIELLGGGCPGARSTACQGEANGQADS